MKRSIPYFWCILLFCCIWNGWCDSPEKGIEEEVELDDLIPEKNQFLSKRTGYVGDSIVIGSHHEPYKPTAEYLENTITFKFAVSVYKCILSTEASSYQPAFETEVYKEENREETSSYFYYIAKEMWTCSDIQGKPEKLDFYRIKNVLISTKEIREIKYIPGTRVARINYSQNERRVRVEEIKYYKKNGDDTYEQVSAVLEHGKKIRHHLILDKSKKSPIPGLSKVFPLPPWKDSEDPTSLEISTSGDLFKIGSTWKGNEKYKLKSNFVLKCFRSYEINPELFRPEVFRVYTLQESLKIYGKISDKEFEESFMLVERTLWHCGHYVDKGLTEESRLLYLVRHVVVGKKPIGNLFYDKGIDSVSSISIPGGTSIRYTEVGCFKYYNLQRVDFDLDEIGSVQFYDVSPYYSTIGEKGKLQYSLRYNEVFKTLISDNGYDLRVGSVKERMNYIHKECSIAECHKSNKYLDEYRTEILVLINKDDKLYKTQVITNGWEKKYYEYTSQEVWSCTCGVPSATSSKFITSGNEPKGGIKRTMTKKESFRRRVNDSPKVSPVEKQVHPSFMRIINKLRILVPIREIETFDGVELIHETSDASTKHTLEIIETKYYNPNTGQTLRNVGEIRLMNEKTSSPASKPASSDLNDRPEWTRQIWKERDEVVDWMDQRTDKNLHLKDCEEYDCFSKNTLTVGQGNSVLQFSYYGKDSKRVENERLERPLYICEPNPDYTNTYTKGLTAEFGIHDQGSKEVETVTDESKSLQYFEDLKTEYWTCKLRKTVEQEQGNELRKEPVQRRISHISNYNADELIRVVYRQSLKKPPPNDIGKIEYIKKNDKVWIDSISDQYVVKTESIRYYKPKSSSLELFDLKEYRLLLHNQKPLTGPWKSGTQLILDDFKPKSPEINYKFILNYRYPLFGVKREGGIAIDVGYLGNEPIDEISGKKVKCKKVLNSPFIELYAARVKPSTGISEVQQLSMESVYQDQDVWKCMRDEINIFDLVRNRISFVGMKISLISPFGNVIVDIVRYFPNMEEIEEATELKFVKPGTGSVIKYAGQVSLEAEEDFTFLPEIIKRLYPKPWTRKPSIHSAMVYIAWLKNLNEKKKKKEKIALKSLPVVTYLEKEHVHISTWNDNFPQVYKIEANFERALSGDLPKMVCLLDKWTKTELSHLRYIPKVVQYVGDKSYEFDEYEIVGKFSTKTKVWFCSHNNKNGFFKVEMRMTPRSPMYILYSGSVAIDKSDKTSTIVINSYIDQKTSEIYKYDKETYELQEPVANTNSKKN